MAVLSMLAGALCAAAGCLLLCGAPALAATPPAIGEESVVGVSADSATLEAQVNPEGSETTYSFEYGTGASYGTSVPIPAGAVGAGTSPVSVQAHVQGLAQATTYHFRVVAASAGGTVDGADQTLRTQAEGGELALPDGRQWEIVSPLNKEGGRILAFEERALIEAAANGDAISYLAGSPTEAQPAGNGEETQILSARGTDGSWSSRDLNTPHTAATGVAGAGNEYRFFSTDLAMSVVEPLGNSEPPLSAKATERTMYLRNDAPVQPSAGEQALYSEIQAEALSGSPFGYLPLVTSADVTPGVKFGAKFPGGVRFQGANSDLSDIALTSPVALTSKSVEGSLYEWSGGRLVPVSVLPGPAETPVAGELGWEGQADGTLRNAISANGSRVFWTNGVGGGSRLYMRNTVTGVTLEISGEAAFQFATSDGSKVFYIGPTDGDHGDLYECEVIEVAGSPECRTSDLTVDPNAGEDTDVLGRIVGTSEDGSYLYFVAQGVLGDGAEHGATPGSCASSGPGITCNLYVLHESGGVWTTHFIAKVSQEDHPDWGGALTAMPARVSPNGRYLEFMSQESLTGYDNVDANSGQRDEEVYLYDALTGHLICASCNPTGARPVGMEVNEEQLINGDRIWVPGRWLAAAVPGWSPMGINESRYQPRYLSDSGRLFFDGIDPLVPQASNGLVDVYEYEPAGVGSCTEGSVSYSAVSGGCVALISSGSSGEESVFLDASESGNDVFFMTSARLVGQDLDTAYDVYDAHACSAQSPCPPAIAVPPACTTADSCRAAPAPQPGVFGAPASATFSGAGNLVPTVAPVAKTKSPKKKQKGKPSAKGKRKGKHKGKRERKGKAKRKGRSSARRGGSVQVSGKSSSSSSRTGR